MNSLLLWKKGNCVYLNVGSNSTSIMVGEINHIVVIESLGAERKTGLEIYNDCIKRKIEFKKSNITHQFHSVQTKEDFIELLKFYIANSPYMPDGILLHLEMHGDADLNGLVLANGVLITWSELVEYFREINIKTSNNLYISMATCNGRYLYLGASAELKSPYSCYISASSTVNTNEIIDQFTLLFEDLIDQGNLVTAYLKMESSGTAFYYKDSKETFKEAFKETARKWQTDPDIKKEIMAEAEEQITKQGMKIPEGEAFDFIMQKALKDTYERMKKTFDFD